MKIRELLSSKDKWTKGSGARDARESPVDINDETACKFCLVGAASFCYNGKEIHNEIVNMMELSIGGEIDVWNDARSRTFEQVKQLVDELDI